MSRDISVARAVYELAHDRFAEDRSADGSPSEFDFVSGPLAAATFAFREFDQLTYSLVPSVRSVIIVDPFFGPVVFVAMLLTDGTVEIVDFDDDPGYWTAIEEDPE